MFIENRFKRVFLPVDVFAIMKQKDVNPCGYFRLPHALLAACLLFCFPVARTLAFQFFDSPGTYPHGLTTDGTNLWNADYTAKVVYELNATGAVTSSFSFSYANPRGLAYSNGVLFVASGTRIYRLNATSGAYLSDYAAPNTSSPNNQGLALGEGKLWVSDLNSGKIYGINPDTGAGILSFTAPGNSPRGLVYYNGSLWNLDSGSELLYRLSTTDGTVQASYPIPLENPRGLTFFNGAFLMADNEVDLLMSIDITNTFASVYVAPSQYLCPGSLLYLPYVSSQPVDQTNPAIHRILFYQHGIDDDAVQYFADARFAAKLAGHLNDTLIISMQLLYGSSDLNSTPPTNLVYWSSSGDARFWGGLSAGSTATYPRSQNFSAYALLDSFLSQMTTNASLFPALQEIVIAGHSGGGQFANRYAATSTFEQTSLPLRRGVAMSYAVMNPSSCVYFDPKRYDPATLNLNAGVVNFITPSAPVSDYDNYGYGLEALSGYQYPSAVGSNNIVTQYPGRKVIYLQGTADTLTNDMDISPEAMLDGTNRYQRSLIYYAYLKYHFGTNNLPQHRFATVAGIGHDAFGMITSSNGVHYVFQDPLHISQFSLSGKSATVTWTGGEGVADVQASTNLLNWSVIATQAASPFIDTNANPSANSQKMYRLKASAGP